MSTPPASPLKFLMPGWYAIVMGLAGLSLAWHRARPMLGEGADAMALAGLLLLAMASLVIAGLALATLRGLRNGSLLVPEPVATVAPAVSAAPASSHVT